MRAIVAVEHAMILAAYTMLTTGEVYRDPDLFPVSRTPRLRR